MPSLRPRKTPAVTYIREKLPRMAKRAREDVDYRYDSESEFSDFSPVKKSRKSSKGILYQRLNPSRRAKTVADKGILAILAASSDEESSTQRGITELSVLDLIQNDSGLSTAEESTVSNVSKAPEGNVCQQLAIVIDSDSDDYADLPDLVEDEFSDLPDLISDSEL